MVAALILLNGWLAVGTWLGVGQQPQTVSSILKGIAHTCYCTKHTHTFLATCPLSDTCPTDSPARTHMHTVGKYQWPTHLPLHYKHLVETSCSAVCPCTCCIVMPAQRSDSKNGPCPVHWKILEGQTTQGRLTLLRLHLCNFLEPVPPHLTVTWLMGLAKALPANREEENTELNTVKYSSTLTGFSE